MTRLLVILGLASGLVVRAAFAEPPGQEPAATVVLPASGQSESYDAERHDGRAGPVPVADDGHVRAGAPLGYRDNGDGTITDLNTGLMWEKKCSGCDGLHDVGNRYRWSGDGKAETIWDWLEQVNEEGGGGFAGHADWRIPNVNELVGIVDYSAVNPSVGAAFKGGECSPGCSNLQAAECSCTALGEYWTSTTFADFPAHAFVVFFGMGLVHDRVKTNVLFVRAVRGGE